MNIKAKLAAVVVVSSFALAFIICNFFLKNMALVIFMSLFAAVVFLLLLLLYIFLRPLKNIAIAMDVVSKGNFDIKLDDTKRDEFGKFALSFNAMTDKVKNAIKLKTKYSSIVLHEKKKSELIISSMADGVIVTDEKDIIILCNPSLEKMFNISADKILNKHVLHFLKRFGMEGIYAYFEKIKQKDAKTVVKEIKVEKPKGKVLKVTIGPIKNDKAIEGIVIVMEDITKAKEIEKMKTEFVSIVSHELRTPLTSIKGYSSLLADEKLGKLDERQKKAAVIIDRESDRLDELINDILDLSKLEAKQSSLELSEEDISECINENIFKIAKDKKISIQKIIPKDLPKIMIDKRKISQVFTNLISNAIKFTPKLGKITIKVYDDRDFVISTITDTGIGIKKEQIPKLFDKFYQAESHLTRNQKGTGLGLAIVKEIIGLHSGLISVKSAWGKGTSISFAIPKKQPKKSYTELCYEAKLCKKTKCPVYGSEDHRCWLQVGVLCKKGTNEQCYDKINLCRYCDVYKNRFKD